MGRRFITTRRGDPCHDHGVKQQQQPAEKAGKQQLNVVFQTVEQGDSLVC